ncbi:MAG: Lar family restriction alleviation protein [Candidatus Hodarchaeota archaeon]
MKKLKACPFCDEKENLQVVYKIVNSWCEFHFVRCLKCLARGPEKPTERKAINSWDKPGLGREILFLKEIKSE